MGKRGNTIRHLIFEDKPRSSYSIAILIKESALNKQSILRYYVTPLVEAGIPKEEIIVFSLEYTTTDKAPVALIKEDMETLSKPLQKL